MGWWRASAARPAQQIEAEIAAELAFHVDEAAHDLAAGGLSPEAARAEALRRFGNFERTRAACRRVQLGERIMWQRIQVVAVVALVAAVGYLGWQLRAERLRAEDERHRALDELAAMRSEMAGLAASVRTPQPGIIGSWMSHVVDPRSLALSATVSRADAPPPPLPDAGQWLARFDENRESRRHGLAVAYELERETSGEGAWHVVSESYSRLSAAHREQLFEPFVEDCGHSEVLRVLHLGVKDADAAVRERALFHLTRYALRDFRLAPAECAAWFARHGEQPRDDAWRASAKEMASRLAEEQGEPLQSDMESLLSVDLGPANDAGVGLAEVLAEQGWLAQIHRWIADGDELHARFALHAARWIELEDDELRRSVLSVLEREHATLSAGMWAEYCALVAREGARWATEPLLERTRDLLAQAAAGAELEHPLAALAEIVDESAVPDLIGLLCASDTPEHRELFGRRALRELTGVEFDPTHDAAWWRRWWEDNRAEFDAPLDRVDIPAVDLRR